MRLGQHETTGERIHRLGFVSTYRVKGTGDGPGGDLLAKVVESDGLPADEMLTHAGDDLIASATVQHAAEDGPGIVRVVSIGVPEDGGSGRAFAVYERYDDSARMLLGPRARPEAEAVAGIVQQARAALAGFVESTGRAHGHATLSNILLRRSGDGGDVRVGLMDPLPAIVDPHRAAQADRRALGGLLLALVTGRSADALRSVEVPPDRDWSAVFGSVGGGVARQLCHDLLFDGGDGLPSVEAIDQALRYRAGAINTRSLGAVAALLVVVVAAGIGWMLTRPPAAPTARLSEAAEALARYPVHFRRFVEAQDAESDRYQRLSGFLVLLDVDPWDPDAVRRPPMGAGSVHAVYEEIAAASAVLTNSQLGRTSTALEGLWRAIAVTPDDAPADRWDGVARGMLAVGQDETSRNAEFMFGAITTMADHFEAAGRASTAFVEAQRARIDRIEAGLNERGVAGSLESVALLRSRVEALDEALFGFFAPREPVVAAVVVGDAPADAAVGAAGEPDPSGVPRSHDAEPGGRVAESPGLPELGRVEIAALFDAALAVEHLALTVEVELSRTNDIGEPVQVVRALSGDEFVRLAPPAFRAGADAATDRMAAALAREFDSALRADLASLLEERNANDRWDATIDRSRRFVESARVRGLARSLTDRLRSTGVVAELGWLTEEESEWAGAGLASRGDAEDWSLGDWIEVVSMPRFAGDASRYSIDAYEEELESWERALREADESNDPRYAALRREAGDGLRSPGESPALAHWPTPERHRVVTARYDALLERVEVAVRVLDPCFPLRAAFLAETLDAVEARLAGPLPGVSEEVAELLRAIASSVRDRPEVRAEASVRPEHPREQCANAARFAERLDGLLAVLALERAEADAEFDGPWAARAERVYRAGLGAAWFVDGSSPTAGGWTDSLASRLFGDSEPGGTEWASPAAVAEAVGEMHALQQGLAGTRKTWRWADQAGFRSMVAMAEEISRLDALAREASPPIRLEAALDDAWERDRIAAARLLAFEEWVCVEAPPEQSFRQAIIAGVLPEEALTPELQGNWLQDEAEFAFLWVRRRTGCPPEALPVPVTGDELVETAKLVEVMHKALGEAPVDAMDVFPELEELPERLRAEGIVAATGYATNAMTAADWRDLADPESEAARARLDAFAWLGMPLDAEASVNPWLHPLDDGPGLSARAQANWALWDAIRSLRDPVNAEESRAKAVVEELVSRWDRIAGESGGNDGSFASKAREMAGLPGRLAARPPDFDLPDALPPGWRAARADADWNAIDITIPGHGTHRFIGARTGRSGGYPTAYIAQDEMSIGFVNALLEAMPRARRAEVLAGLGEAAEQNRSVLGPVGWTVAGERVVPTDGVIRRNEVDGMLSGNLSSLGWFSLMPRRDGGFRDLAGRQPELPGLGAPSLRMPMQMLAPDLMVGLLSSVPARRAPRLPTLGEWEQLAGAFSGGTPSLNLRDRAFREALLAELELFDQEIESARLISTFRASRTARGGVERIQPNAGPGELRRPFYNEHHDGHAAFSPVDEGGWLNAGGDAMRLRHAYGNVAEVVATPGGEERYGLVGGSALSTPSDFGERLAEALPLRDRDMSRPFTDAGFRVAIDAPEGQPYVQVALERLLGFGFLGAE